MSKPAIFFAPGNGFPAGTYRKMLNALEDRFEVDCLELPGHNPELPPDDNWGNLKTELEREIEGRHTGPVIGLGHSLGGVLHLLLAAERPDLYERIVLLEAPIISRFSSHSLRFMKLAGMIDRLSPSQATRYRRSVWPSRETAFEHFKGKPKFAAFDDDVLRDYIEYGTKPTERGFELVFRPQIEAKIYRTIPHHLPRLRGRLDLPITYIGGDDSEEGKLARLGFMRKAFSIDFQIISGSHLFPMERPIETAETLKVAIPTA